MSEKNKSREHSTSRHRRKRRRTAPLQRDVVQMRTSVYILTLLCLLCVGWALWTSMKYHELRDQLHTVNLERDRALEKVESLNKKLQAVPPAANAEIKDLHWRAMKSSGEDRYQLLAELLAQSSGNPNENPISNLQTPSGNILDNPSNLDIETTQGLMQNLSPAEQRLVSNMAKQIMDAEPAQEVGVPGTLLEE